MKNKQEIIEKKFKENTGLKRNFKNIETEWCPKTARLKNHGEVKDRLRCSMTCSECWKLAISELVL